MKWNKKMTHCIIGSFFYSNSANLNILNNKPIQILKDIKELRP